MNCTNKVLVVVAVVLSASILTASAQQVVKIPSGEIRTQIDLLSPSTQSSNASSNYSARILTPPTPATPRINGARVYGERPGRPFLFTIPATGDRPMQFSADGLPDGLKLDEKTGRITGKVDNAGAFAVTLHAKNDKGDDA